MEAEARLKSSSHALGAIRWDVWTSIYVTAMKATPALLGTRQDLVTLKQHRLYLYLENQPAWGSQMNSLQLC